VGRKPGSGPKKRTPEVIEEARQAMGEAPGTSIEHLFMSYDCEKRSSPISPKD
jgi:hypothetical protein